MIGFEDKERIDWTRLDRMKTWAFRLDSRYGELPLWPLVKKLYDWTKNRMADCAEDDSEANELMLKRVPYHALNYATGNSVSSLPAFSMLPSSISSESWLRSISTT